MLIISPAADLDLSDIYNHTIRRWDLDQAEDYLQFLKDQFQRLADDPQRGVPVGNHTGTLVYLAKYNKRRAAYGHRIFYRTAGTGIEILRVLHTSMDWKRLIA